MRKTAFLVLLMLPWWCHAQITRGLSQVLPDSAQSAAGFQFEALLNANTLDNQFIYTFFNGNFIDRSAKDRITGALGENNRAGGDLNLGAYGVISFKDLFRKDSSNAQLLFSLNDRSHFQLAFPSNLLGVGLNGNEPYAGETVNLDPFHLSAYRFQQIQVGLANQKNRWKWGASASLLLGEDFLEIEADALDLFTSTSGDSLHLSSQGEFDQSDSTSTGLFSTDGIGTSLDVMVSYEMPLINPEEWGPAQLTLELVDWGFIQWNDQSIAYQLDTAISYTGIEIDDAFDIDASTDNALTPDSLWDDLRSRSSKQSRTTTLPAIVRFSIQQPISKRSAVTVGFQQRFWAQARPFIWVAEETQLSSRFSIGGMVGAGGYSDWVLGVNGSVHMGSWQLSLYTRSINGWLMPSRSGLNSGGLQLTKTFGS